MSFLDDFLEITIEAESPRSFFLWSGISAISAVVRKNVWINKRIYKLYPNLYIMFIARSALRKGLPVKLAQKMVEQVEVMKVISGQNSIQSVITELSKQWTSESGKIFREAQAFIVNDELDSLIISDPSAQTLLTALYDSYLHPKWQKSIKKDGREVLDNLYITMLTATNEAHLDAFLDKTSFEGGFLGRTLIVHEHKLSRINSLIQEDDEFQMDLEPLVKYLKELSEVKGKFTFDKDAVEFYDTWYNAYMNKLQDGEIKDSTGSAGRAGDTVLKLSMCLSLNDSFNLMIRQPHIEAAINLFYRSMSDIRRLLEGKGKSELSDKTRIVLSYLLAQENMESSKKNLLAAKYGDLSASDLDNTVETLQQAGILVIKSTPQEGLIYQINPKWGDKFKTKVL